MLSTIFIVHKVLHMLRIFPQFNPALSSQTKEALQDDFIKTDKVMLIISVLAFLSTSLISAYTYTHPKSNYNINYEAVFDSHFELS